MNRPEQMGNLAELAKLFLRLGTTAFGGPAAHIALMEQEVVRRRGWLSHEEFLDLLGATNLIPGPNSTELAIHIGRRRAGWPGLLIAGSCFILPAAFLVGFIAWAYVRYGKLPQVEGIMYGVKPVIIAVIAQAIWGLGRAAVKTKVLALFGAIGIALCFLGVHELIILFGTGFLLAFGEMARGRAPKSGFGLPLLAVIPGASWVSSSIGAAATPFSLGTLFLFFVKVGSVLFGSGYVLLAFLRADLVERWHWLDQSQLLDAIAVGQFTPGPVFTTATFIGYVLGGVPGAVVSTIAIFLPAFVFVAASASLLASMRRSPVTGAFLDGVNVASLALMVVVAWQLGAASLADWPTVLLAAIAAALLLRYRVNSAWLVLGGAAVGWLLTM